MINLINTLTQLSEIERIEQLQRMNSYPPYAYRLANWLEARPESVTFYRLQKYFFNFIDITKLGENPTNLLIFLLVFFILFKLIKHFHR